MRHPYFTAVILSFALMAGCSAHKSAVNANGSDEGAFASGVGANGANGAGYYLGNDYSTVAPSNQKYYFEFDSDSVHSEYLPSIEAQARYLAGHPGAHVRLEGNTDSQGSREYNIGLGDRRGRAVGQAIQTQGAKSKQLSVISYGAEKPVAAGKDEGSYHLNRRVDLNYEQK